MSIDNDPEARYQRMTGEPVSKLIRALALPTIASMMVTALYNMVDTYFVGKIDTSATAAVGVVYPLMTMIQMIGMTFGIGSGSFVARLLGKKEVDRASVFASTAFITAAACGAALMVGGELFLTPFMRVLGSTDTILPYARSYGRIILIGAPLVAVSFVMNVNLRSEGSAVLGMIGITAGAAINVILDPIFIFGLRMGISGAAVATVISQLISFLILFSHYRSRRSLLRISISRFAFEVKTHLEIIKSGMPTFFRQAVAALSAIVLNGAASAYGDAAVAGMAVVTRIMLFITALLIGFGQGFQPVAAFNYTAGKFDRVRQAFAYAVRVATIGLAAFALLAGILAPEVVRLFRDDPEVVRIGAFALRAQCLTLPLLPYMVMSNMLFQYIGQPWKSSVLALSRQGLAFVPTILILASLFGLTGIQTSQSVADLITFAMALPLTMITFKGMHALRRD